MNIQVVRLLAVLALVFAVLAWAGVAGTGLPLGTLALLFTILAILILSLILPPPIR